jgi:thioredoxin reductase
MKHASARLAEPDRFDMPKKPPYQVAVLGAGPVGLEAALHARSLGLAVTVYEQGQPGDFVGRWNFVKMFTPFGMNTTESGKKAIRDTKPGTDFPSNTVVQTGKEFRETYLLPLANSALLKDSIRVQTTVVGVSRAGWRKTDSPTRKGLPRFRLLLRTANNQESYDTADLVLDCTGVFHKPNWLGDGGLQAIGEMASRQHIPYWIEEIRGAKKAHYAGKSVIVLGSGTSAATSICDLMELATENQSTWVIWLTRSSRTQPIVRVPNDTIRDRDRLALRANGLATRCDGNLEFHTDCRVLEVTSAGPDKGYRVVTQTADDAPRIWEAERLIANVGYKPDLSLSSELRVLEPEGDVLTGEPGYYILGAKSYGRRSGFMLQDTAAQIRRVFETIRGETSVKLPEALQT